MTTPAHKLSIEDIENLSIQTTFGQKGLNFGIDFRGVY